MNCNCFCAASQDRSSRGNREKVTFRAVRIPVRTWHEIPSGGEASACRPIKVEDVFAAAAAAVACPKVCIFCFDAHHPHARRGLKCLQTIKCKAVAIFRNHSRAKAWAAGVGPVPQNESTAPRGLKLMRCGLRAWRTSWMIKPRENGRPLMSVCAAVTRRMPLVHSGWGGVLLPCTCSSSPLGQANGFVQHFSVLVVYRSYGAAGRDGQNQWQCCPYECRS